MKKFFRISVVIIISISLLLIGLPRILNNMGLNPEYTGQSVELINKRALTNPRTPWQTPPIIGSLML